MKSAPCLAKSFAVCSLVIIALLFGSSPQAQPPEPIPFNAGDLEELKRELETLERNGRLWGAVLIARGDDVLLHEAFGLANRERDLANRTATAFNVASIGKQFTATVVLRLVQEGSLTLDDPIGHWVDDLPGDTGTTVTIRHLLRMESGWGDYMEDPRYKVAPKDFREVSDFVDLIRTLEPEFAAGSDQLYSNVSYELLGAVIEKATGRTYRDVLQELVFEPAGMMSSGCFLHVPLEGRAIPYMATDEDAWAPALSTMAYRCSPAGGAYSTTTDLWRYQTAVVDGKLLDKYHTGLMLNRFEDKPGNPSWFGFVGGTEGANAWVETVLGPEITIAVLANLDPPAAEQVMLGLREWLREHGDELQ